MGKETRTIRKLISFVIIFALLLSGCNGVPDAIKDSGLLSASATPLFTPTPAPTFTPTPSPTLQPMARIDLADWLFYIGDYQKAFAAYEEALHQGQDIDTQAAALTGMGKAQYFLGEYTGAGQALSTVTENYQTTSSYPAALLLLAKSYQEEKRYQEAAGLFQQYLDARPNVIDAYLYNQIGESLTAAGDLPGALAAYEAAFASPQLLDSVFMAVKVGLTYVTMGEHENALRTFMAILNSTQNDFIKAQVNYLAGQEYLAMGMPEQAFARFQESLINYPRSYYTYMGLSVLVDNGIPVDDYQRAKVDYYAGQYNLAGELFNRYIKENPTHVGEAHHLYAMSLLQLGQYEAAIQEWDALILDHPEDPNYATAFDEKAWVQWSKLGKYEQAANTLKYFVAHNSQSPEAPKFLFFAARILEDDKKISEAAKTFERIIDEYPTSENGLRAIFLAGIDWYRSGDYARALQTFQRYSVLASTVTEKAQGQFWIAKTSQKLDDHQAATESFKQAEILDPGSYYSERAREILNNLNPMQSPSKYSLDYDLYAERATADGWVIATFSLPDGSDLSGLGPLAQDIRMIRAQAFLEAGMMAEAKAELESMRAAFDQDAPSLYRLMNFAHDNGIYRTAIFSSRQILRLAGKIEDNDTFTAPLYFNHIRFGVYYRDLIVENAAKENLHPYLLLSAIRQESMFEGFVTSSAGAQGLFQIMPATGAEVAKWINWPPDYSNADLARPFISMRLGSRYMAQQISIFEGNLYGLAAYNGGPGNAYQWKLSSGDDEDLFFEVIDIEETRQYVQQIFEFYHIYGKLYNSQN